MFLDRSDGRKFYQWDAGRVLGDKVSQLFELGIDEKYPVTVISFSGGARMQEGIAVLQCMAKFASVVGWMNESGLVLLQ